MYVGKFQSSKALWCFFRCLSYMELSYSVVVRTLLLCLGDTWPPKLAILCYIYQSLQDTVTSLSTLIHPVILILMLHDTVMWSNKNILSEEKDKIRCGIRNHLSPPEYFHDSWPNNWWVDQLTDWHWYLKVQYCSNKRLLLDLTDTETGIWNRNTSHSMKVCWGYGGMFHAFKVEARASMDRVSTRKSYPFMSSVLTLCTQVSK